MSVLNIHNPTDKTIETEVVRNGLWPGWSYLMVSVSDEEWERLKSLGAVEEKDLVRERHRSESEELGGNSQVSGGEGKVS